MSEAGKVETERPQNGGNPASGPVSVKRERLTIERAVAIIGLPARTVQGMSQRGEIPGAAKFGRRWTYNEDKLHAYVRNKERESWRKKEPKIPGCYWENGVIYFGIKIDGKRFRGSLHTSDPKRAKQLREAKKKELTERIRFGADDPNDFVDVLAKWLVQLPTSVGPNTETRYICSMDQLKPYLHNLTLAQIDRKLLWTIVEDRQKVVTNATIKRDLTALSALVEYAIARGWMGERPNPVPVVMRAITEKREPINLPHDDDIALRDEARPPTLCGFDEGGAADWMQDRGTGQCERAATLIRKPRR